MKKALLQFLIPRFIHLLLSVIGFTCKVKIHGKENIEKLKEQNKPWIYSLWHSNVTMCTYLLRNQNIAPMVSESKDGEYITRVAMHFGFYPVRGSSSKGGKRALLQLIKEIHSGKLGLITPDGPRGPRLKLQSGVIAIASKTKAPLIPWHFESSNQWVFNKAWDLHKLPKPFSTIHIHIGKPFYVAQELESDEFKGIKNEFEEIMINHQQETFDFLSNTEKI